MATQNIFTYGSLMFPTIWAKVVGTSYETIAGTIEGFQRLKLKDESFPGLCAGEGKIQGVVYLDVQPEDILKIDEFEGDYYEKINVLVNHEDSRQIAASAYIVRPEFLHLLTDKEWTVEEFMQDDVVNFVQQYFD